MKPNEADEDVPGSPAGSAPSAPAGAWPAPARASVPAESAESAAVQEERAASPEGAGVGAPSGWKRWRMRIAPIVLVGGLVIAFLVTRASLPDKRAVTIRLDGDREDVRIVTLLVTAPADPDDELTSIQWRFDTAAPSTVRTEIRLPAGDHRFHVEVMDTSGNQVETDRVVRVSTDTVTIRVPTR